jgi:hypothetical protein
MTFFEDQIIVSVPVAFEKARTEGKGLFHADPPETGGC